MDFQYKTGTEWYIVWEWNYLEKEDIIWHGTIYCIVGWNSQLQQNVSSSADANSGRILITESMMHVLVSQLEKVAIFETEVDKLLLYKNAEG